MHIRTQPFPKCTLKRKRKFERCELNACCDIVPGELRLRGPRERNFDCEATDLGATAPHICGLRVGVIGLWPTGTRFAAGPAGDHAASAICGWIGVGVQPMTTAFADSLGMAAPYGAIFDSPEAGSPAASVGIEMGDVLTTVNGNPLERRSDFAGIIASLAPGETVISGLGEMNSSWRWPQWLVKVNAHRPPQILWAAPPVDRRALHP
jgi:hypothetical protein